MATIRNATIDVDDIELDSEEVRDLLRDYFKHSMHGVADIAAVMREHAIPLSDLREELGKEDDVEESYTDYLYGFSVKERSEKLAELMQSVGVTPLDALFDYESDATLAFVEEWLNRRLQTVDRPPATRERAEHVAQVVRSVMMLAL